MSQLCFDDLASWTCHMHFKLIELNNTSLWSDCQRSGEGYCTLALSRTRQVGLVHQLRLQHKSFSNIHWRQQKISSTLHCLLLHIYSSSIYGVEIIYEHIQRLMYSTATARSTPAEDQDHWQTHPAEGDQFRVLRLQEKWIEIWSGIKRVKIGLGDFHLIELSRFSIQFLS